MRDEEHSIAALLGSLFGQTRKPEEIIIIDGGSADKTVEIIRHFQKKDSRIRLLVEKCSRGRGRNLGVELARNEIIAMTDAGCVAKKNWLKKLTQPFETGEVDLVAGFYKMTGETPLQKAMAAFLGVGPSSFDIKFLPATRSVAFTKELWERIGEFPEGINTAEDTVFNHKAIEVGARIARVRNARVEWKMPETVQEFQSKIYEYAKGDVRSGIWWNSEKKFKSHNVKVLLVFARYLTGLIVLVLGILGHWYLFVYLFIGLFIYCLRAFRKAGFWGIVLQFVSDVAVMRGFVAGILKK